MVIIMDGTKIELIKWLVDMGYNKKIPESIENICNASTSFLWDQVINNSKPKQEVKDIHRNVTISRLIKNQGKFNYIFNEIEVYNKRQVLRRNMQNMKTEIKEIHIKTQNLLQHNKIKYITLDNLKSKIKQYEEKKFILSIKFSMLQEDIKQAIQMLNFVNIKFIEKTDKEEIQEIIDKCTIELTKFINSSSTSMDNSMKLLQPNYSISSTNETTKTLANISSENTPNKKRQSLGLLPDTCLIISENMQSFSLSNTVRTPNSIVKRLFSNDLRSPTSKNYYNNSFLSSLDSSAFYTSLILNINEFSDGKGTRCNVKKLLNTYNKQVVVDIFYNICSYVFNTLERTILIEDIYKIGEGMNINKLDLNKLYLCHVKNELEIIRYKNAIKTLNENILSSKNIIFISLNAKFSMRPLDLKRIIEMKIKEIELSTIIVSIKKELLLSNTFQNTNIRLQDIYLKLLKMRENIILKITVVLGYLYTLQQIFQSLKISHDQNVLCVKRLNHFMINTKWIELLYIQSIYNEMQLFQKFPSEYNRRCAFLESKIFLRNTCSLIIPINITYNTNILHMLTILLGMSFGPMEIVILNILKFQENVKLLKLLKHTSFETNQVIEYSPRDFFWNTDNIQFAFSELDLLNNSNSIKKTSLASIVMRKMIKLWSEMPFRNFISTERYLDGHDYKFYDNKYYKFYDNWEGNCPT